MKHRLYRARKHAAWMVAWRSVGIVVVSAMAFCAGIGAAFLWDVR